ncbi:MAG: aconitase family protein [Alphaproteobacteria bacterium]
MVNPADHLITDSATGGTIDGAGLRLTGGSASGEVIFFEDGLSFWGGVDPETGIVIDAHHPARGQSVTGKVVAMPTSRGSCSGSGVLLELALNALAPAALIFREAEEILTLGALVAGRVFDRPVPVLRLPPVLFQKLSMAAHATIDDDGIVIDGATIPLEDADLSAMELTAGDQSMLDGADGPVTAMAMDIICRLAVMQGADRLVDVTRGHIDGCILAHDANLRFAEAMAAKGARIRIPTTINAISVDRRNWRQQGVDDAFGSRASRLADSYVDMGAVPSFTCAPYLLSDPPKAGECIGWSESNAVIYANSVLGARTLKIPDYLDLFVAMTGRAPYCGTYADSGRQAQRIVELTAIPADVDDGFWPLLGWVLGKLSPDRIPLLRGLEGLRVDDDAMKAICAAFGSTSGAPMLHIAGHTPEAAMPSAPDSDIIPLDQKVLADAWRQLNSGGAEIDLVAIGSPHISLTELHLLDTAFNGRQRHADVKLIVTIGRNVLDIARQDGVAARLEACGVTLYSDLCWCSITQPLFPPDTKTLMTNSGKYAHYATGLSGCRVRLGGIAACVEAAVSGIADTALPRWLGH